MKPLPKLLASLSRPLALIALSLSLLASAVFVTPARAATFTVTKTADTNDGTCNFDCSLREAITVANASAGADIITLPAGTYQLTITNSGGTNEDNNATGDLDIKDSLTINGAGSGSTIIQAGSNTSNGIDKVIALNPICTSVVNVTITGVMIQYGRNTQPSGAADFSFTGGGVDWCGYDTSNFTLSNSVISNNTNVNGYGGGLNLDAASPPTYSGTVNISGVTFDHNQTNGATGGTSTGGAINIFETRGVTISNSTFTNNQTLPSTSGGGAIYYRPTQAGSLNISGSAFSSNTAGGIGGAIATATTVAGTTVSITNSTFNSNTATNSFGGALDLDSTVATTTPFSLSHLKITGNTAGISGGGVYVGNSNVTMSKSLIIGNSAPSGNGIQKSVDATTATVTNNWWGCSTGPSATPCDRATTAGGTITFTPWYRDQLTATTSPIVTNQSTFLTASFLTNSASTAVPVADLAEIIGRSVTWAATNGNLFSTQGTVQAAGTATSSFQATAAGTAVISAKVDNDNTVPVSSNVLSLTVNKANTTTAITNGATLSSTTSVVGQPVAVNFSVTGAFGNSPTAPTGNVTVSDGTDSCIGTATSGTCNLTFKTAGPKTLTATFGGDSNFNVSPASALASHTVNKADTTTTITTDTPDPSITGQFVTFNVTVAANAPGAAVAPTTITGTVTVSNGGTNTCIATLTAGAGSCDFAFPGAGPYSMTGTYGGDTNFNGSASTAISHTVNKASTTTTITSDNPDPSSNTQSVAVNFTVSVTAPGAGTLTGNVTVGDGVDTCIGTVAAGTCSLTFTTGGARTLTATYAGDSNFANSTSIGISHTVNDVTPPSIISSLRANTNLTNLASVDFTVTFSELVTGVDVSDFTLTTTGVLGAAVSGVSGSGSIYTVSISTGSGSGTIRLDVVDDDTIVDVASNLLGGVGTANGNFNSGETYDIDKTAPTVSSSVRVNSDPTALTSVGFTVTFSESVTGVNTGDFTLTTTGVSGAGVSEVSGSGSIYTVTVSTGSGNGTIRLDVLNDGTIVDAEINPLGAGFTSGETYTVTKVFNLFLPLILR